MIQVRLTESQVRALKNMSAAQNKSMEELIRQAVDMLLRSIAEMDREERKRRAISPAGRYHSGLEDLFTDHDDYLSESYMAGNLP